MLKRDLLGFAERARSRKEELVQKFNFPVFFLFFRVSVSGWMKEGVPFMGEKKIQEPREAIFFCVI